MELKSVIQKDISSCDLIVPFVQNNIAAQIEPSKLSAYTQNGPAWGVLIFGLIDGAVNSHRINKNNEYLKPINQILKDMLIKEEMEHKFHTALKEIKWLGHQKTNTFITSKKEDHDQVTNQSQADVVLHLSFGFEFSPKLDVIVGTLNATMFSVSPKMISHIKEGDHREIPIYKKSFMASERLSNPSDEAEDNVKLWLIEDGVMFKQAISTILDTTILLQK